jgi:hypothetical protein
MLTWQQRASNSYAPPGGGKNFGLGLPVFRQAAENLRGMANLATLHIMYPSAVIAKAADPARGIPAFVVFPNLAKFREQLERILDEYDRDLRRERRRLEWQAQKAITRTTAA